MNEKRVAEVADQARDSIENPEEYWRKLEAEIRSWPKLPPQPECDEPPPFI